MTPLPGEEWIAKQEPKLKGWLSKAALSLTTVVGPLLLIISQAPLHLKVAGSIVWVLFLFSLWLLSWLAIYRNKVRELEAAKPTTRTEDLSSLELSILELMRSYYPELYTREEIEAKLSRQRFEVDAAILSLLGRTPPLVCKPRGGLMRPGQPHPAGWGLSTHGMTLLHRREEKPAS